PVNTNAVTHSMTRSTSPSPTTFPPSSAPLRALRVPLSPPAPLRRIPSHERIQQRHVPEHLRPHRFAEGARERGVGRHVREVRPAHPADRRLGEPELGGA